MPRIILILCAFLTACAAPSAVYRDTDVPINSMAVLDAERYAGLWYEIARFPVGFQEGCINTTATYEAQPTGTLSVLNRCIDEVGGQERLVRGIAEPSGPGRFEVRFNNLPFIKAPYWVLWVDEGYRTAVVGVPSGSAGWILNREPTIPEDRLVAALEILDFNGYDVSLIEPTPQR